MPDELARLERGRDLVRLALADERGDGGGRAEDLEGGDAPREAAPREERLRDDRLERVREHDADLALLAGRERADDAVDRGRARSSCGACRARGGPVSEAVIASEIVSRSRISPTRMTSGSSRSAALSARANEAVWCGTCRWFTSASLFWWTNSTGSSTVMMWQGRVSLIRSMSAASVVDFPHPDGPVTRTSPCVSFMMSETVGPGRPISSIVGIVFGTTRKQASNPPRWEKKFARKRPRPGSFRQTSICRSRSSLFQSSSGRTSRMSCDARARVMTGRVDLLEERPAGAGAARSRSRGGGRTRRA